ncbi:MAG TPA: hypothetical protein VND87_13775 [Stellaceae bacterium]|nr:hypothetical protein [Stellaceae bacterium]
MAKKSAKSQKAAPPRKPLRPVLLAGGLGLVWFIEFQQPVMALPGGPPWSYALVIGMRLLADVVCARLLIALAQLVFAAGRLGLARLRIQLNRDVL